MICACLACRFRRLGPPLTLIALGVLLLAHMLRPNFSGAVLVGGFLLYAGAFLLALRLLPVAAIPPPHPPRRGLFVPLLLLAAGALVLLRHLRPGLPLGGWLAQDWPLLLIIWGLVRLLEHYTHPPRLRPGFSGGEILLLIVIVLGGLAFSGVYRFGHSRWADIWGVNVDAWNPFFQSYSFTAAAQAALPPGQGVRVVGWRGNVQLRASAPGAARVAAQVTDTVQAGAADQAQRLFQSAQPAIRFDGDQITVFPAGDTFHSNLEADLVLTLPATTPVDIQIQNGDVAVSGWRANVAIRTLHGAISADRVQAAVRVSGGGGDVALSNITGPADLSGSFFGDLSFRNLAQGLHLRAGHAELRLASLPGGLDVDPSRIGIDGASGIVLATRDQAVEIQNFTGPLDVSTRNQPVEIGSDSVPSASITVADQNADITLTLPPASAFNFQTRLRNASVTNPFPRAPSPAVTLSTSNGTIAVQKAAPAGASGPQ